MFVTSMVPPPRQADHVPPTNGSSFPILWTETAGHSRDWQWLWLHQEGLATCDNTFLSWWNALLVPNSPKSLWWMIHSIFQWCAFLFIPIKKHHQNVIQMYTATFQGYLLVLTMSSHHHQLILCQYFQHCFSFSYVTSILWHSIWKGQNRNNVVQDL